MSNVDFNGNTQSSDKDANNYSNSANGKNTDFAVNAKQNDTNLSINDRITHTSKEQEVAKQNDECDSDLIECKKDMDYLDINNDTNNNEEHEFLCLYSKYDDLISLANSFYAKNEIVLCKAVLKKLFTNFPTRPEPFYILGLIFEDEQAIEEAYNCFLNFSLIKKSNEMYLKMYEMSMALDKKVDAIYFIKRLLKTENSRQLAEQRVNLYKELYMQHPNTKIYYYKMLYCTFEMIEYDGYVYFLKDYISDCNLVHIKKIINIICKFLKVKKSDTAYFENFLDLCFNYKEFECFKDLTSKHISKMTLRRKIQYLVAKEETEIAQDSLVMKEIPTKTNEIEIRAEKNTQSHKVPPYDVQCTSNVKGYIDTNEDAILDAQNLRRTTANDGFDDGELLLGADPLLSKILYKEYTVQDFLSEEFDSFDDFTFFLLETLEARKNYTAFEQILNKFYHKIFDQNKLVQSITFDDIESVVFDNNMIGNHNKYKYMFYVGMYCRNCKKLELAISIFRKLNRYRENDETVCAILQDLYLELNDNKMAKVYTTVEHTMKKRKIVPEEVITTREKYYEALNILYYNKEDGDKDHNPDTQFFDTNETYTNASIKESCFSCLYPNRVECDLAADTEYRFERTCEYHANIGPEIPGASTNKSALKHNLHKRNFEYDNLNTQSLNKDKAERFVKQSQELLRDFFNNTTFFNKEVISQKDTENLDKAIQEKTKSKQAVRWLNVVYKKLHGLEIEEWFELIKLNIVSYMELNEYNKAMDLIHEVLSGKTSEKYSRQYVKYFDSIGYLGLKFAVFNNDISAFIKIAKKLYKEPLFLIYFFCNYIPDYVNCLLFKQTQRNLHRVLLRNAFDKSGTFESNAYSDGFCNIDNNQSELTTQREKEYESHENIASIQENNRTMHKIEDKHEDNAMAEINKAFDELEKHENTVYDQTLLKKGYLHANDDTRAEFILTLMPRNLHKKSLHLLESLISDNVTFKESILLSIIFLNHATSTKDINVKFYCEKGFQILLNLEKKLKMENKTDELFVCWYNLGRAYTMFGLNGLAEHYYKKSIQEKGEVGSASFYNIAKVYKANGNNSLYDYLEQKHMNRENS